MQAGDPIAAPARRRRGILLDALYVLAPLVLLAVIGFAVSWYIQWSRSSATRELVSSVMRAFVAMLEYGEALELGVDRVVRRGDLELDPAGDARLEQLSATQVINRMSVIVDIWGTPLRVRQGHERLEIRSAGADRLMDTRDDEVITTPALPLGAPPSATKTPRSDDRGVSAAP